MVLIEKGIRKRIGKRLFLLKKKKKTLLKKALYKNLTKKKRVLVV